MMTSIIVGIMLFAATVCLYILIRNHAVYSFQAQLISMAYDYEVRHLCTPHNDAFNWFSDKHSYCDMLFSFKPLKLESWFTEEELEEIKS